MIDNELEKVQRLRQVMDAKRLSQKQMADLLGIQAPNLSAIFNKKENRSLPSLTAYALEVKLNINSEWFETGKGKMDKPEPKEDLKALNRTKQEIIQILKNSETRKEDSGDI